MNINRFAGFVESMYEGVAIPEGFVGTFETAEEARAAARARCQHRDEWYVVLDLSTGERITFD